jgi:uncharacterized membrane protein
MGDAPESHSAAESSHGPWLDVSRLISLSDGIFAFAMTLLVVTIDLGGVQGLQGDALHQYLLAQWRPLLAFLQSFCMLAVFWTIHHRQFGYIRRTDHRHTFISLGLLFFVVLMPYTTDLLGDAGKDWVVLLLFAGNMLALGLFFMLSWSYATHRHRLVDSDLSEQIIANGTRRGYVVPLCSLGAGILAFFAPSLSSWCYLLIPFILLLKPFRV